MTEKVVNTEKEIKEEMMTDGDVARKEVPPNRRKVCHETGRRNGCDRQVTTVRSPGRERGLIDHQHLQREHEAAVGKTAPRIQRAPKMHPWK